MNGHDEESKYERLKDIFRDAYNRDFQGEKLSSLFEGDKKVTNFAFKSIDDYQRLTGKRFRIKKHQIERGLSREEAFKEFIQTKNKKD